MQPSSNSTNYPQFGYAIIYVEDVPTTVNFYEKAFGFSDSFIHEGKDYAELKTGQTKLAFTSHKLAANAVPFAYQACHPQKTRLGVEFTLTTPDVDTLFAKALSGGAEELAKPHDMPWGQRVAYVADINGLVVGLATPMNK